MSILSIICLRLRQGHPIKFYDIYDLDSFYFYEKPSIKKICLSIAKILSIKSKTDDISSISDENLKDYIINVKPYSNDLSIIMITNHKYSNSTLINFFHDISKICNQKINLWNKVAEDQDIDFPEFKDIIIKYSDINNVDKISIINNQLDQSRIILIDSIQKVINRGEKIDDLIIKSEDLEIISDIYIRKTKNLNSCCIIL